MSNEFRNMMENGVHKHYTAMSDPAHFWQNAMVDMSVTGDALLIPSVRIDVPHHPSRLRDVDYYDDPSPSIFYLRPTDVNSGKTETSEIFNSVATYVITVSLGKIHENDFPEGYKHSPMFDVHFNAVKVEGGNESVPCPTIIETQIGIEKDSDTKDPRYFYNSSWQLENHPEKAAERAAWQAEQPEGYLDDEVGVNYMTVNSGKVDVEYELTYRDQPELAELLLSNQCNMVTLPNPLYEGEKISNPAAPEKPAQSFNGETAPLWMSPSNL